MNYFSRNIFFPILILLFIVLSCRDTPVHIELQKQCIIDTTLSFRGIYAVDKNTVFVSGTKGSLYYTKDSGENWKKINPPGTNSLDFRDVAVIDQNTLVVMSAGAGNNSKIFKSTDNGKTWIKVYENPYSDGFLDSIEFWNDQKGIAIGDPVKGKFNILLTIDGGDSWHEVDSSQIPEAYPGEAQFAASGTCISVTGKNIAWIGTGGITARILKTTDNGNTWKTFLTPVIRGLSTTGIFSVHFSDEKNGVITGGDYLREKNTDSTSAFTEDGGKTWQLVLPGNLPYQSSVKSLTRSGITFYLSTGPAGTYFSENKKEWKKITETGFNCMSVSEVDNSFWTAGSKGSVAKFLLVK